MFSMRVIWGILLCTVILTLQLNFVHGQTGSDTTTSEPNKASSTTEVSSDSDETAITKTTPKADKEGVTHKDNEDGKNRVDKTSDHPSVPNKPPVQYDDDEEEDQIIAKEPGSKSEISLQPCELSLKEIKSGKHICTAIVLNSDWLQAPAHCVSKYKPEQILAVAAKTTAVPAKKADLVVKCLKFINHPLYSLKTGNPEADLTLIQLEKPLVLGSNLKAMTFDPDDGPKNKRDKCHVYEFDIKSDLYNWMQSNIKKDYFRNDQTDPPEPFCPSIFKIHYIFAWILFIALYVYLIILYTRKKQTFIYTIPRL